jgi:iron complex transport system ATP-binding protein
MSFSIEEGEIVGLLGPNGSGKSTLLGALCGIVRKNGGIVRYCEKDVASAKTRELARVFSLVPQGERFLVAYTVLESVVMGRYSRLRSFENYDEKDYEIAGRSLARVSLDGFEGRNVTELSGGESARILIARALAQDSPVMLLDEPTAALDPKRSLEITKLIKELSAEGKIILLAIHDINLAMETATRLLFLKDGDIASDRKSDEVDEKLLEKIYGIPWEMWIAGSSNRRFAFPAQPS